VPPGKGFRKLSSGTQMKLALALALSHDADLLLLDEPTAGLDLGFRRELLGHLSGVLQDERKSVLFSTHVTSDLERIADYVTFIRDGEVVVSLPKDELRDGWGIVKGNGSLLERLSGLPVRGFRRAAGGVEALVADVAAARERCGPEVVIDRPSLDDAMVFLTRGDRHVDAH
jgi:ABC-2 type transport system ATP-binding protein